jgi:hypothetical protein
MRAAWPSSHILLDLIMPVISGDDYELRSVPPFCFPHMPATSIFFYTNILLSTLANKIGNPHLILHLRLLQMFHLGILPTFIILIIHFYAIFWLVGSFCEMHDGNGHGIAPIVTPVCCQWSRRQISTLNIFIWVFV